MTSDEFAQKYDIVEGIFDDISDQEYHHGKYRKLLSNSGFKHLKKSALHYKTWRDKPQEEKKDYFEFGKAYHIYILENASFNNRVAIAPEVNKRTKEGKAILADFEDKNQGKVIISKTDFESILAMSNAIKALSKTGSAALRNPGSFEKSFIWRDPAYGIWCKCRTDLIIENIQVIIDLKSTTDASPFGFPKNAANFDYPVQAAFYLKGVNYLTGKNYRFAFLAQEKTPPYAPGFFFVDEAAIMDASDKIDPLMQRLAAAFRTGEYECYPDEAIPLQLPAWYR